MAYFIGQVHPEVAYIEVVSSIASRSAGPATRINIDEYIETTEKALKVFAKARRTKAILILNPAQPCIDMQTTVFASVAAPDLERLRPLVADMVSRIQAYVPGYQLIVPPVLENNRIVITVKVQGRGDYLPRYAGNLDIINSAAMAMAEAHAKRVSPPTKNCHTRRVSMTNILISDPTLRDGNHAVQHQLNAKQIAAYAAAAESARIPIVEVGHGNGLGASSLQVGESLLGDREMLQAAREKLVNSKLGVHTMPGFATINKDLNRRLKLVWMCFGSECIALRLILRSGISDTSVTRAAKSMAS